MARLYVHVCLAIWAARHYVDLNVWLVLTVQLIERVVIRNASIRVLAHVVLKRNVT